MKRLLPILIMLVLLCSLPFAAKADEITFSLEVIAPKKQVYIVGEEPDYTGGMALYTAQTEFRFELKNTNCAGFDTDTPGNKTVTVRIHGLEDTFRIVVLSKEDPILTMKDISAKHWSYSFFGPCMRAGYFAGDDAKLLHPDSSITRAEMAQIIYRAWKTDAAVMAETESPVAPFPDVAETAWYYEAVDACRKAGILRGTDTGECLPEDPIRREDAILMLMRIQYTDEELSAIDIPARIAESGVNPTDFDSVSGYAKSAIAAALGTLVKGDENRAINPGASITRAESATIFYRLFLEGKSWSAAEPSVLVYLSPSNQFDNAYAGGITTEGAQMTVLATRVKELLEERGFEVVLAEGTRKIDDRSADANAMGADLYIPIHSNAGGNQTGTYVFYNGAIPGCEEFSREVFDRLAALTGTEYSTSRHKEDYLCLLPDGAPFREIKNPTMPIAYIEVEFHDKADKAQWIVNNNEALALAIADGVSAYTEKYLSGGENP